MKFTSETTLETFSGTDKKVVCALNESTGQVSARIQMTDFTFDKSLMQRHFNEKYVESEKFPLATLEGKLATPPNLAHDGQQQTTLQADMTIHGVKKTYSIPAMLTITGGHVVKSTATWDVPVEDHAISRPFIVRANIAEKMKCEALFEFK